MIRVEKEVGNSEVQERIDDFAGAVYNQLCSDFELAEHPKVLRMLYLKIRLHLEEAILKAKENLEYLQECKEDFDQI